MTSPRRLAVIITALPIERTAVIEHLRDVAEEPPLRGSVYRKGIFDDRSDSWDVIVAEIGAGNEAAAAEAVRDAAALESAAHADLVQRTRGFLYHPERPTSVLVLALDVDFETAKQVARNKASYVLDLTVADLRYEPALEWGYFLRDELVRGDWDIRKLLEGIGLGSKDEEAPAYFSAEMRTYPSVVRGTLVAVTFRERTGRVIASFKKG